MDYSDSEEECVEMNDNEEMILGVNEEGDEELKIGMEVYSDDEAFKLYNAYALKKGFSIRKGTVRRNALGSIRQRDFLCSKEGFRLDDDLCEEKKVDRLETRTGCKALIRFTVKDNVWKISHINPNHNHKLATLEERAFLRSGRKIPKAKGATMSSMVDAGIRPTKSFSFLAKEVGGAEFVGFTKKDCQNYLQRKKNEMIEGGDGQSLINHFKHKQAEDPDFFYTVQVDQFNRMTNFFWRDGKSKLDYDCFGDVVCFDTTFRTNKYNLICAPFVGVNHHWKNVLFGCAFLLDESTESFVWLFEAFLEAMGHRQPKTIFTDEDKAMANAIEKVLPETRHRLCIWHISKNATKHLVGVYSQPKFKEQFHKCYYGCHSVEEFEATWDVMIKNFDLASHSWLQKLYSLKEKWCSAFSLDTFSARIRSTQRSESTNNVFHQISTKTMNLVDFVHHYEAKTEEMRLAELQDDFHCKNGIPHQVVKCGLLNQATHVYTIKMFQFFKKEFVGCMGVRLKEVSDDAGVYIFEATNEDQKRVYLVQFNSLTSVISCSCKLFESMGLLCRHALKVFDLKNITSIPDHYILKRWTKGAKKGVVVSSRLKGKSKSSHLIRLSELNHEGRIVFDIGSMSESGTKIVKAKLAEAMEELERDRETMKMVENFNKVHEKSVCDNSSDEPPVLNPPCIRTKGTTNARMKNYLEKRKRTASKNKSQMSHPNPLVSGQHNQGTISGPPLPPNQAIHNPTVFDPSFHHFGVPGNPNFHHQEYSQRPIGCPNFHFTSMFQGNNQQMLYSSQDSSRNLATSSTFGQLPHLTQDSNFYGLDQLQHLDQQ